jgi:hypothetical protein
MPLINYIGNRQEALAGGTGGFVRGGAPLPPALSFDYLIVGGGMARGAGIGGSAGGFRSGSTSLDFNTTIDIVVGAGTTVGANFAFTSSMSGSSFGYLYAGGASSTFSGDPQFNQEGTGTPTSSGGGAGASQGGVNGIPSLSGRGGDGLMWLDGKFYAGGGGGQGSQFAGNGDGTIDNQRGGGGRGAPNGYPGGLPGQNGLDGFGGGAGGGMEKGGDGVVIIRYSTGSVNPPYDNALSGGTITIADGYIYRTFTGSAQLTYSF